MAGPMTSNLKFRSLGIVVKDKERESWNILVDPIEEMTLELGELDDSHREYRSELQDARGVKQVAKVKGGSAVEAKWLPFGDSNRATPPDVCKGETVMIWQYGDTQKFAWTTAMFEPGLRHLEIVRYMYSNLPSGITPFNEDSSYWMEWDTVNKRIRLHTSDNDGEAAAYDFEIDGKTGTASFKDNVGNSGTLVSPSGDMTIETTGSVNVKTKNYTVDCETYQVKTNSYSLTSNSIEMESTGSAATLKGNFELEGNMHATGSIKDEGGNTNHHSH